jgi:hypothetical protein
MTDGQASNTWRSFYSEHFTFTHSTGSSALYNKRVFASVLDRLRLQQNSTHTTVESKMSCLHWVQGWPCAVIAGSHKTLHTPQWRVRCFVYTGSRDDHERSLLDQTPRAPIHHWTAYSRSKTVGHVWPNRGRGLFDNVCVCVCVCVCCYGLYLTPSPVRMNSNRTIRRRILPATSSIKLGFTGNPELWFSLDSWIQSQAHEYSTGHTGTYTLWWKLSGHY